MKIRYDLLEFLASTSSSAGLTEENLQGTYRAWCQANHRDAALRGTALEFAQSLSMDQRQLATAYFDQLQPMETRRREGEFYTPPSYVKLAHDVIASHDPGLYQRYWWDMACGTGNLLAPCPKTMADRVLASTLHAADLALHEASGRNPGAIRFSCDFLGHYANRGVMEVFDQNKKWVWIVNPPYFDIEGTSGPVGEQMVAQNYGRASRNITLQFMHRIKSLANMYELDLMVGLFSQPNFLTNSAYQVFTRDWRSEFGFLDGFCFPSEEFQGTTGEWPVLFSLWDRGKTDKPARVTVYQKEVAKGHKVFQASTTPLNMWADRSANTESCVPLSSAIKVATKSVNLERKPVGALGYCVYPGNDVMHSKQVCILSSAYGNGTGWAVTEGNFCQSMVAAGARAMIKGTWLNDHDQFNTPDIKHPAYAQFETDVILWLLFSNFNHSAEVDLEYDGVIHHMHNHFFWRSPDWIRQSTNLIVPVAAMPSLVSEWIERRNFSADARALLDYADKMLIETAPERPLADPAYQMQHWSAGWYQLRKSLLWGDHLPAERVDNYRLYKKRHQALAKRLTPLVYELGMLPETSPS